MRRAVPVSEDGSGFADDPADGGAGVAFLRGGVRMKGERARPWEAGGVSWAFAFAVHSLGRPGDVLSVASGFPERVVLMIGVLR
jgi:hypothetical protein